MGTPTNDHPMDCLCTICSCGAHRCPADRVQGHYNNIKSEHQSQFTGQYVAPQRAAKETYVHQPRPFVGNTTHQEDFCYWGNAAPRQPSEGARRNNNVFGNNLPFDGKTTNQTDFRRWNAAPAKLAKEMNTRPVYVEDNRSFQTEVSSQFDFKDHKPRKSCEPARNTTENLPFDGQTTQNADYIRHNAAPARSTQRRRVYRPRSEDREFSTEARGQFVEKEFDVCPAKPLYKPTKEVNGHVIVEQDRNTGSWNYSQTHIPMMQQQC